MIRWVVAWAFLLLSWSPVHAQDRVQGCPPADRPQGPVTQPEIRPVNVIRGTQPLTRRVVFVVDCSGSMVTDKTKIPQAMAAILLILGQPLDELQVACIAFTGTSVQWPGRPDPCPAHEASTKCRHCLPRVGWARLPDAEPNGTMARLNTWVRRQFSKAGATNGAQALAMALGIQRRELSIVFVGDGEMNLESVKQAVERGQRAREGLGLGQATIMVFGTGPRAKDQPSLHEVAKLGHGGLWVLGDRSGPW